MYFHGSSIGNPGRAGAGAVIYYKGNEIWKQFIYVGDNQTNNYAEYTALILGLSGALHLNISNERLSVFGDSGLVINKLNGKYKVNSKILSIMHDRTIEYVNQFKNVTFHHTSSSENTRAKELAEDAISFGYY